MIGITFAFAPVLIFLGFFAISSIGKHQRNAVMSMVITFWILFIYGVVVSNFSFKDSFETTYLLFHFFIGVFISMSVIPSFFSASEK